MRVVAAADYVIDLGPGAGDDGGTIVASGTPGQVAERGVGASAKYLTAALEESTARQHST
ncbi:hypothetical protein ACIRFF_23975 [Streptomyces cyaneofuscatus]